ncbi:MAG: WecB/TagA/CpsF family glycosyltransferase, partial [Pseudomonadota bacterium]
MREVVNLMGLPFDLCSMPEAVARMATAQEKNQRLFLSTPNVNFLINSLENAEFRRSIFASDLVVMDGMPLVWIAKLLGLKNAQRVAGSDLFTALDTHYRDMGKTLRVFFFGGRDGAAQAAHKAYADCTRGVKSVGYLNPGFGSVDDMSTAAIHETINAAKPDFVIVSLGADKGQRWIMRNKCDLDAPLISHLGAVVDFCAGTVKRSPGFMSRLGLEWVWRIFQEPALWRRYWFDGFTLLKLLVLHVVPMIVRRTRQRPDG